MGAPHSAANRVEWPLDQYRVLSQSLWRGPYMHLEGHARKRHHGCWVLDYFGISCEQMAFRVRVATNSAGHVTFQSRLAPPLGLVGQTGKLGAVNLSSILCTTCFVAECLPCSVVASPFCMSASGWCSPLHSQQPPQQCSTTATHSRQIRLPQRCATAFNMSRD
jgi:hypothetical protein